MLQVLRDTIAKASKLTPAPGATPPPQNAHLGSNGPDILKAFDVSFQELQICESGMCFVSTLIKPKQVYRVLDLVQLTGDKGGEHLC